MKILIVSYLYPPYNCIGAVRLSKLSKYLIDQGCEVKILTATEQLLTPTLKVEIPPEEITATRWFNVNGLFQRMVGKSTIASEGINATKSSGFSFKNILAKLASVYKYLTNTPDAQIGWYPFAIKAGNKILSSWQPDVIYSSSAPITSLLVAKRLADKHNIPHIAEFRDLWAANHAIKRGPLLTKIVLKVEQYLLQNTHAAVVVSDEAKTLLVPTYKKPILVLNNGFDPADYDQYVYTHDNKPCLNMVYTGMYYPEYYDVGVLFAAIQQLGWTQNDISIQFYGRFLADVQRLATVYQVADIVSLEGQVPYSTSVENQCKADVLLMCMWHGAQNYGVYSGKFFEYLGANRPILGVGPKSLAASELILEHGVGAVEEEVEALATALVHFKQRKETDTLTVDSSIREQFSRQKQAEHLHEFLQGVLSD